MRVLIVDYSIGFGGAIKSIGLVSHAMDGITFEVLTCQEPSLVERWYGGFPLHRFRVVANYRNWDRVTRLAPKGVLRRIVSKATVAGDLATTIWNVPRLQSLLRRRRIDLVHLNNGWAPPEALHAARTMGVPVVAHLRGFPSGKRVLHVPPGVRKVIAVSHAVADAVTKDGFPTEDTPVVWDPVDLDLFARVSCQREPMRARLGILSHEIAVGIVGRVIPWKGQWEFVQAVLCVLESGLPVRPVIVGDASDWGEEYVREVHALIDHSPYADRFIFTGYQPEPAPLYHALDIVVHASTEPEPFGMVVPEAMAAGKPVIASAAGGPLETIEAGVDGLLTPPLDIPALAEAVACLASDSHLRQRLGARGLMKAREHFSVGRAAAATRRVWESALRWEGGWPLPRHSA